MDTLSKRAVMLAGGLGTRLRPYTLTIPKPLVPIGDTPIAEIVIRQLCHQGFDRVTLAVNHQAELLMEYFGDGSRLGIAIDYFLESKRLGTMGPVSMIPDLPDHFLVVNGDVLTSLDFMGLLSKHVESNCSMTVATAEHAVHVDFGVLTSTPTGEIIGFVEKPSTSYTVSIGAYALSLSAVSEIPRETYFGFDNLIHSLIEKQAPVSSFPLNGFWLDIGRPADYELARKMLANGELNFFPFV